MYELNIMHYFLSYLDWIILFLSIFVCFQSKLYFLSLALMLGVFATWITLAGLFREHALLLYCTQQSQKREHKALALFLFESCVNNRYFILNYLLKILVSFFWNSSYLLLNRLLGLSFSAYFLVFILLLLSISSWDCKLSGAETVFFGLCLWSIQHSRILVHDATWIQININNSHLSVNTDKH